MLQEFIFWKWVPSKVPWKSCDEQHQEPYRIIRYAVAKKLGYLNNKYLTPVSIIRVEIAFPNKFNITCREIYTHTHPRQWVHCATSWSIFDSSPKNKHTCWLAVFFPCAIAKLKDLATTHPRFAMNMPIQRSLGALAAIDQFPPAAVGLWSPSPASNGNRHDGLWYAEFSRMRSKGSRFTLGSLWACGGIERCSPDVAFTSATVRNRPQPFATVRNHPREVRVRAVWLCL